MEVLVFGSCNFDLVCFADRMPAFGETLNGNKFVTGYGGKGANQAVAAARLGAKTAMVAKVGDDLWGNSYLDHLKKEGVNVDNIEKSIDQTTGVAQIIVSPNGDNAIIVILGANNHLNEDSIIKSKELFDNSKILLCQQEVPSASTLAALRAFKGTSILNVAPATANLPKEIISAPTILCTNEFETSVLTGIQEIITLDQCKAAMEKLIEMGANAVILTLGPMGATYVQKSEPSKLIHVPSIKVDRVVDTTGAGDAFLGALAYFMARFPDAPLHQQIGGSNEVAAFSIKSPGTQASYATPKDLTIDLTKKTYNYTEI